MRCWVEEKFRGIRRGIEGHYRVAELLVESQESPSFGLFTEGKRMEMQQNLTLYPCMPATTYD
jgi:hypothetical protein